MNLTSKELKRLLYALDVLVLNEDRDWSEEDELLRKKLETELIIAELED